MRGIPSAVACLLGLLLAVSMQAQLILPGAPVPRTTLPPVVFINGYQFSGCPTSFADTFGVADQVLQTNGEVSLFFSTCTLPATASIEDLAAAFATFLSGLTYTDGQPVQQVDVVAHSMGGLVLRAYLAGKQNAAGVFEPPPATRVRKAVYLGTPHFGTPIGSLLPVILQVEEISSGSAFLFGLDTWNDGTDDLRGVDAIAAAGNGGTGLLTGSPGFDDGVVALTSASLRFYGPGRTRVLPYCHTAGGGLVSGFGLCPGDATGIAKITSASHDSARMILSFFNGTNDWQNVGTAAESDPFLSAQGGLIVAAHNANDSLLGIDSAAANAQNLAVSPDHLAFTDMIAGGAVSLSITSGTTSVSASLTLPAGGSEPYTVKPGPWIARVFSAAAANFPLELAPRMLISIYGANLANATVPASGGSFPTQLADAQVLANGSAAPLYYVSATQINAFLPASLSGLVSLTVQNSAGQHSVNILLGAAAPAVFTLSENGTGPAAALKATDQSVVSATNALHPGDYVELFATGLGLTSPSNGLNVAVQQPTVTVEGLNCPVTFAGAAPGYIGLDQVNCRIPSGTTSNSSAQVMVTSGTRTSNTATLAIE